MSDYPAIRQILFTEETLRNKVAELGKKISEDYRDKELVLIAVLKGSMYFFADLTRAIDIPVGVDMISIGNIPDTTSQTGIVRITKDLDLSITGKHVLVVEDIIRTGLTTAYLIQSLDVRKPIDIKVCTLLYDPDRMLINVPIAYYGFEVKESWMVGYGMDIGEKWRNLPYIGELEHR
ncbi:MAG: hypoxanthine phosphoribosyltransferase [Clostridiaceae bacterium]|jgi:hypoxanthine phosphoribosyltransferase|nr:hypoxanthine phosphoribosyltransferase [Oscillospiraceae bacterium]NLO61812.1 hypoxanthine phosphoribosyltransferase [Clostridiaceae bacterium]